MQYVKLKHIFLLLIGVFSFSISILQAQDKILMVVTNNKEFTIQNEDNQDTTIAGGYELSEVSQAYKVFTDCGYQIDVMSPQGGATFYEPTEKMDEVDSLFLTDVSIQEKFNYSLKPSAVKPQEYVAIYFAGGKTMWDFPDNPEMAKITAQIYEQGGIVGAVCHGPAALVNVKLSDNTYLIQGKRISSFTNLEEELFSKAKNKYPFMLQSMLEERGAIFQAAAVMTEQVIIDERLITGQNPVSTYAVAEKMMIALGKTPKVRFFNERDFTLDLIKKVIYEDYETAVKALKNNQQTINQELLAGYALYSNKGYFGELPQQRSIDMLRLLVYAFPQEAKNYEYLATAYKEAGDNKMAIQVLRQGLDIDPQLESSIKLMDELEK